jgi:hypothetical protein
LLEKCRKLVAHLKRSTKLLNIYKKIQKDMNRKEMRLIQQVVTRWNSTLFMLRRLLEKKLVIQQFFNQTDLDIEDLSRDDFKLIELIVNILEAPEQATSLLSGSTYSSLSLIMPMMTAMLTELRKLRYSSNSQDTIARSVRNDLINSIDRRFNIENISTITNATLLDPRVKDRAFTCTDSRINANKILLEGILKTYRDNKNNITTNNNDNDSDDEPQTPPPKKKK